jgi:predicted enzyme related to lactoylglutathione lyase
MSERDGFQPGVPCWVAAVHHDAEQAAEFYSQLFGWQATNVMPAEADGKYFVCTLRGRAVAAVVSPNGALPPAWATHVWVDSADDTAARAAEIGGRVVGEPFASLGGGRMAVISDPSGATFCAWEPRELRGAELVNEPGAWSMSFLNTADPGGAEAFYGELFGWETEPFGMGDFEATMWRLPGYVGGEPQQPVPRDVVATMGPPPAEGVPAHWSVDFWVDDVDLAADTAARLGGKVIAPPYDLPIGEFRQAVLADPFGATFTVSKVGPG